jgi:hypothetical protein
MESVGREEIWREGVMPSPILFSSVRKQKKIKGLQRFWNGRFVQSVRKSLKIREL